MYGHLWVANYGSEDQADTWLKGLSDLTPEHLAAGLRECLKHPEMKPPTLPQFRMLCKSAGAVHECHRLRPKALPEPKESKAQRLACGLAAVRAIREQLQGVL
jgi:hypothetical protein